MTNDDPMIGALRTALPAILHHQIAAVAQVLDAVLIRTAPVTTDPTLLPAFQNLQGKPLPTSSGDITVQDVTGTGIAIGHGATVITVQVSAGSSPHPAPNALHQLRPPGSDFMNRIEEIAQLVQALTFPTAPGGAMVRINGIRGLGGIGKTELAYVVAHRVQNHFPDAQIVLDMRGSTSRPLQPIQALYSVVRAFLPLLPPPDDINHMQGLYHSLLRDKRVLVLADDVLDTAQVRPLLPPPGSALLITSRRVIDLPGMVVRSLDTLPLDDAVRLLLTICPRIGSAAPQLAEHCGCLPLALRVSATFLKNRPMRSVVAYLQELSIEHARLQQLQAPGDPVLNVEASLNLSYLALAPDTQRALRHLGVFSSSFELAAAQAVIATPLGDAAPLLEDLYTHSLLDYYETTGRYALHDLVRLFALSRLHDAGEEAEARRRHAQHYAHVARQIQQLFEAGGPEMQRALRWFDQERPRISSGWRWVREQHPPTQETDALQITYGCATMDFGDLRYHPRDDRIPQYEAMLVAARRLGRRNNEGIAHHNLGQAYAALGEYRQAIVQHEQNLQITHTIGNRVGEAIALGNLGRMYAELGDYLRAVLLHQEHLHIARAMGDVRSEGLALGNLGYALTLLGEPDQAIPRHRQQLVIAQDRNDPYEHALALNHLGLALLLHGEDQEALTVLAEGLKLVRELGDRRTEGRVLDRQGRAYAARGEPERAIACYDQSLAIAREMSDEAGEARTSWRKGEVLLRQGRQQEALPLMQQTVAYYQRIGHTETPIWAEYLDRITQQTRA